jgi:hypothetical protein
MLNPTSDPVRSLHNSPRSYGPLQLRAHPDARLPSVSHPTVHPACSTNSASYPSSGRVQTFLIAPMLTPICSNTDLTQTPTCHKYMAVGHSGRLLVAVSWHALPAVCMRASVPSHSGALSFLELLRINSVLVFPRPLILLSTYTDSTDASRRAAWFHLHHRALRASG